MCKSCKKSGHYDFKCLDCCARLVLSTKPDKDKAKSILAAIGRYTTAPSKKLILDKVKYLQDQKM